MSRFERGILYYTSGTAHIRVHFPEDRVCCRYCPYCRPEAEMNRYWCRLTNEMIYSIDNGVGANCPIELDAGGKKNE